MTQNRAITSSTDRVQAPPVAHPAQLTGEDYDALGRELEALRSRHRWELEQQLRDARASGSPADDGRTIEYVLVGRRHAGSGPHDVSSASPVGMALLGTRAGDVVDVVLPNGRRRSFRVMAVEATTSDAIRAA